MLKKIALCALVSSALSWGSCNSGSASVSAYGSVATHGYGSSGHV